MNMCMYSSFMLWYVFFTWCLWGVLNTISGIIFSLRKEQNAISSIKKMENVCYYVLQLKYKTRKIFTKKTHTHKKVRERMRREKEKRIKNSISELSTQTARNENLPVASSESALQEIVRTKQWQNEKKAATANFEHLKWKIEVSIILLLYHH